MYKSHMRIQSIIFGWCLITYCYPFDGLCGEIKGNTYIDNDQRVFTFESVDSKKNPPIYEYICDDDR